MIDIRKLLLQCVMRLINTIVHKFRGLPMERSFALHLRDIRETYNEI